MFAPVSNPVLDIIMALDGIFIPFKNEIAQFAIDSRVDKIHQPSKDEIIINLRSKARQ